MPNENNSTASQETSHVNMYIGGSGDAAQWESMSQENKDALIDSAFKEVQSRRHVDSDLAVGDDTNDKKETNSETSADGDEISADGDAAEAGKTVEGEGKDDDDGSKNWLDQKTRDFAMTMGLSEDDLSELGSRDELDRVLRIIDRKAFEAGKTSEQQVQETKTADVNEAAYRSKQTEQQGQNQEDDPFSDLSKFKLGEDFEEDEAKPINAFVEAASTEIKNLRSEVAQLRQERQQEAAENLRHRAEESLLSLGHHELFGKPGETPTPEQAANIEKAIEAHFIHAHGLFSMGRQAAPTPEFLKAAVQLSFGDQILQQQKRQITDKLRKQSAKRTGGAATKVLPGPPPENETPRQRAERLAAEGLRDRYNELALR